MVDKENSSDMLNYLGVLSKEGVESIFNLLEDLCKKVIENPTESNYRQVLNTVKHEYLVQRDGEENVGDPEGDVGAAHMAMLFCDLLRSKGFTSAISDSHNAEN